jgi:hypothetical protein
MQQCHRICERTPGPGLGPIHVADHHSDVAHIEAEPGEEFEVRIDEVRFAQEITRRVTTGGKFREDNQLCTGGNGSLVGSPNLRLVSGEIADRCVYLRKPDLHRSNAAERLGIRAGFQCLFRQGNNYGSHIDSYWEQRLRLHRVPPEMETFLKALAGTLVGLVIVILIGWWWIRRKIASITDGMAAMKNLEGVVPPFRITLNQENVEWTDEPSVNALSAELDYIGYVKIGDYQCPEMFLAMRAFQNPERRTYAVIYNNEASGVCVDLLADTVDGRHLCVSSHPMSGLMMAPEWIESAKVARDLTVDAEAVVKLPGELDRLIAGRSLKDVSTERFAAHFIDTHHREMDWNILRGGVTETEVRRFTAADPTNAKEPDQESIQTILDIWSQKISDHVDGVVRDEFLRQNRMTAAEWDKKQNRVFFLHDRKERNELINSVCDRILSEVDEEDEEFEKAEAATRERIEFDFTSANTIREGYADALLSVPSKFRPEKIGSVDGQYPADVYLYPEGEFED